MDLKAVGDVIRNNEGGDLLCALGFVDVLLEFGDRDRFVTERTLSDVLGAESVMKLELRFLDRLFTVPEIIIKIT